MIADVVSAEIDARFEEVRRNIVDVWTEEELRIERQWNAEILNLGENDIVVLPTMADDDFDKISRSLVGAGVRGIIMADDVRIIRLT